MNVQPVSFGARVKIDKRMLQNTAGELVRVSPLSTSASSGSSLITGSSALQTAGSASDVLGTALVSKASGINSSGIVPSVMESAGPVSPGVVVSSQQHPSLMGSIMSTIGGWINGRIKNNQQVKAPN